MKIPPTDTPALTDASAKEATGKPLKQWFTELGKLGAKNRREMTQYLYSDCKLPEWWAVTLVVEYEKASGQQEKDGKPKGYSICATKTIAAPLGDVFAAFGDPKQLDRWLGPKTKGKFADGATLENADGDKLVIQRIRAGKDLRMTWEHPKRATGSQVEVLFADKGKGKTGITLNHTRIQDRAQADELRAGWGAAFDALKALLEQGS